MFVLLNSPSSSFYMNTQSCNSPSLLNFSATQLLPIVFKKGWNVDGDAFWCEHILEIKSSVSQYVVSRLQSSNSLEDCVMDLSETYPLHKSDTKVITPPGLIPTKHLEMVWLL